MRGAYGEGKTRGQEARERENRRISDMKQQRGGREMNEKGAKARKGADADHDNDDEYDDDEGEGASDDKDPTASVCVCACACVCGRLAGEE